MELGEHVGLFNKIWQERKYYDFVNVLSEYINILYYSLYLTVNLKHSIILFNSKNKKEQIIETSYPAPFDIQKREKSIFYGLWLTYRRKKIRSPQQY